MTEQQRYGVVERRPGFEIRRYPEHLVSETVVAASFEQAGNQAFRRLARFIGGHNAARRRIAMTAPVLQEQTPMGGSFVIGFVMPGDVDLTAPPAPEDATVTLRRVPADTAAALRFSGRWTKASYEQHERRLLSSLATAGLRPSGPPRFARYNPPWTPLFARRNEVIVPVAEATT